MNDPYIQVASEVVSQPEVLHELSTWFDSDKPRSAQDFGQALGELDVKNAISPTIAEWIDSGRCALLTSGYLKGVSKRVGQLPQPWIDKVDSIASQHGEYSAQLTFETDVSSNGLRRILALIGDKKIPVRYFRGFVSPIWTNVLDNTDKARLLHAVVHYAKQESELIGIGLAIIVAMTKHGKITLDINLFQPCLTLLKMSRSVFVDSYYWSILLNLVAKTHPFEAAALAIEVITSSSPSRNALEREALDVLKQLAKPQPQMVMQAVGARALDKNAQPFFGICQIPGLFEAIGVQILETWVEEHGTEYLRYFARHLDSPSVQDGQTIIPPVTEWIFTKFEQDDQIFRQFCSGRHFLEVRSGHARDRRGELEKAMQPFLNHRLRRVREWARYELDMNERDSKMDDYFDDRLERE